MLAQTSVSLAQAKVQLRGNVYTSVRSDSATDVKTERFYQDKKGNMWPVYKSKSGKLYALRTSAKGKVYKFYIKPDSLDSVSN